MLMRSPVTRAFVHHHTQEGKLLRGMQLVPMPVGCIHCHGAAAVSCGSLRSTESSRALGSLSCCCLLEFFRKRTVLQVQFLCALTSLCGSSQKVTIRQTVMGNIRKESCRYFTSFHSSYPSHPLPCSFSCRVQGQSGRQKPRV